MEQIELIKEVLQSESIPVYPGLIEKFSKYRELLLAWNRRINLVSRGDEERIVTRHFLESMGLINVVTFSLWARVVDLGSGAGFPGIPMKLVRPDLLVTLVESKRKKVLFLRQVVKELCLVGIEVVQGRMEDVGGDIGPVDFVVSRSVSDLVTLVRWSRICLNPREGRLIAIKGPDVEKEVNQLEREAPDLGVKKWERVRYNPFPWLTRLRQSYVVVVEMSDDKSDRQFV